MQKNTNNLQSQKPFRLVKFFTFSSILIMFVATMTISALTSLWIKNTLLEKSKEYDSLLVENLNHQIITRFIIPAFLKHRAIRLRDKEQFKWMDDVVRSTLHSFNVEMVTIYDEKNIISYSFDKSKIGEKNAGGLAYEKAMKREITSKLVQKNKTSKFFFWEPKETKMITIAPLKAEKIVRSNATGPVLGVVEVVRDLSEDYKKIFKLQGLIIISCFLVMSTLFIGLLFVVKRGEEIIEKRAKERIELEKKLRHAEHLSIIGEMTAGVSHEVRNPLGIIQSSAQLLKQKMTKLNTSTNIADIIIEESTRLNNIISDFLNFARPQIPDLQPCAIDKIIEKNLSFLALQIEQNCVNIIKDFSLKKLEIMADKAMLYQAFLNILLNAFQAINQNGCIKIKLKNGEDNIIINFIDDGHGIQENITKKIWTPFFTTKDNGTGLGLGIVKNIIEAHDGTITIKNRKPTGVNVEIILPI